MLSSEDVSWQRYKRPTDTLSKRFYRLNLNIQAPEVRLLSEENKQIGVFTREEALRRARELNVDLVEIAPQAKPPVCKLIDFKKFKYQESKREREIKKKAREVTLKELRLRPFIGDHDFQVRVKRGREFLDDGDRVKVVVSFFGREITRKEFGFEVIRRFSESVADIASQERPPKFEGKTLVTYYSPGRGSKHAKTENEKGSAEALQANEVRQTIASTPVRPTPAGK